MNKPLPPREVFQKLHANLERVIHGQSAPLRKLLAAFASDGHVLLEDFPGTDKTTLAKALAMFKAEVRCKRGDFDAVRTRCRIDGDADWTDLGLSVGTTLVDERPPATPGKPEVRTYEQIYVRNNQPVGQWSDSVRVTLQP